MSVRIKVRLEDPRLDPYRGLKRSNLTRWSGLFIAEGEKVVERLLMSDFEVVSILADEKRLDTFERLSILPECPVLVLPREECEQLTGFNFHQGVLACGRRPSASTLPEIIPPSGPITIVVAPWITNPENLGTLLRLSAAFGIDAIVLGTGSADPLSRRSLRVSMGAALAVPCVEGQDAKPLMKELKALRTSAVATVLDSDAVPLHACSRPERLALFFGNEAHGLPPEIIAECDSRVTIPMSGTTDSLNVAASAAIVLYHFTRVAHSATSGPELA